MTEKQIDLLDMRHFWFIGKYLIWTGAAFPWLHIKRRSGAA
jgi:hypothetical protein